MKKIDLFFKKFAIFFCVMALVLASWACNTDDQPAEIILDPNSPEAMAFSGGDQSAVTTIDNRPTVLAQYNTCIASIDYNAPNLKFALTTTTYGQQAADVFNCGQNNAADIGLVWVLAESLANLTPTPADNATVVAVAVLSNTVRLAGLLAAAYLTGYTIASSQTLVMEDLFAESHSNQDHNPFKKNSKANILYLPALITTIASTGGNFDPSKFKCGFIKIGTTVVRAAIWMATDQFAGEVFGPGTPGMSASYKVGPTSDQWVGAYPKSSSDFESYQPSSVEKEKGWNWVPKNCNDSDFPKPPTMLNAAQ